MNMSALKETLRKQCDVNHQTVVAIQTLKRFNDKYRIVDLMKAHKGLE